MKDQQARENIERLFEHIRILSRNIDDVEKKIFSEIEKVHYHRRIESLEKEKTELREKLNAKNK